MLKPDSAGPFWIQPGRRPQRERIFPSPPTLLIYDDALRYDTILKTLFQSSRLRLLESLTHASVREWINVEIPNARMNKLDLVAWLTDGRLYHLELQSGNDADMARRMVEYYLLLWRRYGVPPVQMLIYVGRRPMAMSAEIQHENMTFRYRAIDMRELDS